MIYHNNILCVSASWLEENNILSVNHLKQLKFRGHINVLTRACKNTPSLIEFDSLPDRFKTIINNHFPDIRKTINKSTLEGLIKTDAAAAQFYSEFKLQDNRNLPSEVQNEYRTNVQVLNAIHQVYNASISKRRALGGKTKGIWESISSQVNCLDQREYAHTLPTNLRRLKERYQQYIKEGYTALIHKGYCNDNSRKVDSQLENLILSLYTLPNKPYTSTVHELYLAFLGGAIQVVNTKTGELYNRLDFYNEDGTPIMISEATVWNYINDPKNRILVDKYRSGGLEFNNIHRPHHHRHAPNFSLSKISMDDRDLPRKLHDGGRVKSYLSYEVLSGAVIGIAYARKKDKQLFINCMRNMFQFLHQNDMGMPLEVEVEHHLVNSYKDDLMKAEVVFPFVRWCNPGNSQEKHAEHFNKAKKYGYEKRYQDGIGRWYAKLEANRTIQNKVFDEDNDNYKSKTYEFDQLIADDLESIEAYNNGLHPNQKKYKGLSRLEVLKANLNPDLATLKPYLLARYIGNSVDTSIRRSQYVTVNYTKYQLPAPEVMQQLLPNNYEVTAYWLPKANGSVPEIYIYQGVTFICKCDSIATYNTSSAEQTKLDKQAYQNQSTYVRKFDEMVKTGREELGRTKLMQAEIQRPTPEELVIIEDTYTLTKSPAQLLNEIKMDIERDALNDI